MNGNAGKRILPVNREVRKKSVPLLNERKFEVEETDGVPSHFQLKVNVRIVGFKVFEERASFIGGAAPNKKYIVHISPPGPDEVSARVGCKSLGFEATEEYMSHEHGERTFHREPMRNSVRGAAEDAQILFDTVPGSHCALLRACVLLTPANKEQGLYHHYPYCSA